MAISRYARPEGGPEVVAGPGPQRVLPDIVRAISEYSIETDSEPLRRLRENLAHIGARLVALPNEPANGALETIASDIRAALREYRDHGFAYVSRLRDELSTVSEALATLLSTVQGGSSSETRLQNELGKLRSLAGCSDIQTIHTVLQQSASTLAQYADEMRRERDAIIAQLKAEIQELHKSLEDARYSSKLDASTGVCRRNEFVRLLRRKIVGGESVGIAFIRISNFHKLCQIAHPTAASEVMSAFLRRAKNVLPSAAVIGSWDERTCFVLSGSEGLQTLSKRLRSACVGRYVYIHHGAGQSFDLSGTTGHMAPNTGEDVDSFVERLDWEVSEAEASWPGGAMGA